ncbi:unnamed protein product, partial [Schistocephalus solidus]|uniref:Beta-lactamase domain-containing protein n=1 Tax=Schistocephalus solidus TaxID=70667 RepID=A0A183TCK6_SCHSO
ELIESGYERGAGLVVFENGKNVFDIVGGYADIRFEVPWSPNTITPIFGSSVLPVAFIFGLLKDRNLINESVAVRSYSEKFPSKYLTVAELLTHMTGYAYPTDQLSFFDIRDEPDNVVKALFKKHPTFPSGTPSFHFHTLDLIAGDIVSNVDIKNRPLARFFLEEIRIFAWLPHAISHMSMQFTLTSSRWACLPVGSVSYMNTLRIFYAGLDLHIGSSPTQMFRIARTYHAHALTFLDAAARLDLGHLWHRFFSSGGHRTRAINIFKDYEMLQQQQQLKLIETIQIIHGANRAPLVNHSAGSITEFLYDPQTRITFDFWYKRYEDLFSVDQAAQEDARNLRLNYHPDFVEVPLSSVNFFTNARALANLLTHLLPKSDPSPLFSESTLQWMLSPGSVVHDDPILQRSIQYTKSGLFIESSPEGKPIFGLRDDILGQVAFVDPARNLTFAYVTNHAHGCSVKRDWILKTLIQTIYACL